MMKNLDTVVLDITDVCSTPMLTGVQRISRGLSTSGQPGFRFIRFDHREEAFFEVSGPSTRKLRIENGVQRWFRLLVRGGIEAIAQKGQQRKPLARWAPPIFLEWLWEFYSRRLGEWYLDDSGIAQSTDVFEGRPNMVLAVSEIPRTVKHLQALSELCVSTGRLVCYLHDLIPVVDPNSLGAANRDVVRGRFLEYLSLVQKAQLVIGNSHTTVEQYHGFRALFPHDPNFQAKVLYPPLDLHLPEHAGHSSVFSWQSRFTEGPPPHVLFVGNLGVRKNLEVVLRAMLNLHDRRAGGTLHVVAGGGREMAPGLSQLMQGARRLEGKRIFFYSDLSETELRYLYSQCDILVSPSLNEGLGLPLLEAASFGLRILGSDSPINQELSETLPIQMLDPHDVAAWETAIASHPTDPHQNPPELEWSVLDWNDFSAQFYSAAVSQ